MVAPRRFELKLLTNMGRDWRGVLGKAEIRGRCVGTGHGMMCATIIKGKEY
jgi:hypothetical protein